MTITRLTAFDRMFLRLETPDWPCHYGGLAIVAGEALLDARGQLRMDEIRTRLDRRVARIPQLRRRVHDPGPLRGGPLWVDDDEFDISGHVRELVVDPPGDELALLEATDRVYCRLLDRRRPLWELWFLTGLGDGRVGVLLKLHHAVADGLAAVAIIGALFDRKPDVPDPDPGPGPPVAVPILIPGNGVLVADRLAEVLSSVRRAAVRVAHPLELFRSVRFAGLVARRYLGAKPAPRTSLNQPVRSGRRIRFLRLDLAAVKQVAHVHGGTANDVALSLWAGGLRELMVSRGEAVAGVELVTGLAVSLRPSTAHAASVDNRVGAVMLRLPVGDAEPTARLEQIVDRTRRAKTDQQPVAVVGPMARLAATPVGRRYTAQQRANNLITTNVIGPTEPVYLLGAHVLKILPIIELIGNIGLTLCAFSYAGELFLVVTADAAAFPDLDVLVEAMGREWHGLLAGSTGGRSAPAGLEPASWT
jgi:diacylglycerol O-acyltransferase / wax synthase